MKTIKGIYGHVYISPCNVDIINSFSVKKHINIHDEAFVTGIISKAALSFYKNSVGESTVFSIQFEEGGEKQLLFSGLLQLMDVKELNGQYDVTLHFAGLTKALDYKKKTLDYQEEAKTASEIISGVMKGYPDIPYRIGPAEGKIERFLLQYEETDYEFLTRVLSINQEPVYTRSDGGIGQIHFGKETGGNAVELDIVSYEMELDKNALEKDRKNKLGASNGKEYLVYRTVRTEFLQIGDEVRALGQVLYVKGAEYSRIAGVSRNRYFLCEAAGLYAGMKNNANITGISLDGTITKVLRDRVKVELDATPKTGEEKARWFSYSTAASSGDGSGWYCMPEAGEQIRLYFPTEKEEDAYVISAIRGGGGAAGGDGGRTSSPGNKSLATKEGQEILFTDDGANIACAGGSASMQLNKDGTLEIISKGDLYLTAANSVNIRAEGALVMQAKGKITLTSETGSSFEMLEQIDIKAKQIKNNS